MDRRRKATLGELEEGERQMKQAQKRMEKEAEERGEKALEDQTEVERDETRGSEVVLASQAVVAKESSKGTPKAEVQQSPADSAVKRPQLLPPSTPPPVPPESFASPAKVTPLTKVTPEFEQVANGPETTKAANSVSGNRTGESERGYASNRSPPRNTEASPDVAPLFTQEQLNQIRQIQDQAPWLYAPSQSMFTHANTFTTPARPLFLTQEELNRGGAVMSQRDPQLEYYQERFMHDQVEKEEIRKTLRMLVEENRQLKNRLEGLETRSREEEDQKFSTPEEEWKSSQRMKQVASDLEEAAKKKEAAETPKETHKPQARTKEAAEPPEEAADPPKQAEDTPRGEANEAGQQHSEKPKGREGTSSREESFTEKTMQFMMTMMETMKEMQRKVNDGKEETGMIRGVEVVRSGVQDLPALPPWTPNLGPLQLGDWMLLVQPVIADLSLSSEEWWSKMTNQSESWYQHHLSLGPLDRLQHLPDPPKMLQEERWQRLERRVSTMILQALPEAVREELVSARRLSVFGILTHLLLTYCPGGVQEKQTLLRNLEDPSEIQSMAEAPAALRRWMRWRKRTQEIGAVSPDPTILLKGLNKMTKKLLEGHRELQFRISLIRSSLLVDTAPSEVNIGQLATHILSEVDQLAHIDKKGAQAGQKGDQAKIKTMEVDEGDKGKGKGKEAQEEAKGKARCKFYLSEAGCRRGKECSWPHEGSDGKRRCYICGSTEHLAPSCTRPRVPNDGSPRKQKSAKAEGEEPSPQMKEESPSKRSPAEQSIRDRKGSPAEQSMRDRNGSPAEQSMRDLLEEANKMLKSLTTTSSASSEASKEEDTKEEIMQRLQQQLNAIKLKKFQLKRMSRGWKMGLIDSGATHPLRPPRPNEDVGSYRKVTVSLADGTEAKLPMTSSGVMIGLDDDVEPIVPMGLLTGKLGCEITWRGTEVQLSHPKKGNIKVHHINGCPQISRRDALDLIQELEEKGAEIGSTAADFQEEWRWMLKLIDQHPIFSGLPQWLKQELPVEPGEWSDLPTNRRQRKKMKRDGFIAHIYAGPKEGFTLQQAWKQIGGREDALLEIDICRGAGHDMLRSRGPYSSLIRAALEGKLNAIVSAPNCRTRSILRHIPIPGDASAPRPIRRWGGEEYGIKDITEAEKKMLQADDILMWRVIFLYVVASSMAKARRLPEVLFTMEQPASPRAYNSDVVSWWDTKEWKKVKEAFRFQEETLEQGRMGGPTTKPTTFGGSLKLSSEDFMERRKGGMVKIQNSKELSRWAPGVMNMVASALMTQVHKTDIKMKEVTWAEHIAFNHVPFRRDCRVCQESAQQCSPHKKVKYPQAGVLSLDTAGPMIPAYDQGGYQARYFLVGVLTWRVPRGTTKLDQPEDEAMAGDEPKIEDKEDQEAPALEDQEEGDRAEEEDEVPVPPGEDGSDQRGLAQLPEEAEDGARNLIEETEMKTFRLALPMVTKTSREVTATTMEMWLKLKADGYHVGHIHSDRGHEFQGHFKQWARVRGIHLTRTSGDDPRGNGRAEVCVKAIKDQVRRTLRQAGRDSSMWPWALRYVNEINRCVRLGVKPWWPRFLQEVRVRKRTWRKKDFEVGWEKVLYLLPSAEDHGHWVMKEGEVPRVTKCIMRPTLEPEDEQTWIALENDAEDAWTVRRRLREKSAVRRMDVSMRPQPDEEEEEEKHKQQKERIQQILKEEAQHLIEDDPEIANDEIKIIHKLKKMMQNPSGQEEVLQTKIISPKEVARDWEKWLEAVDAEVNSLTREKEALKKLTPEEHQEIKRKAEEEGRKIEYLPTKVVFTVKPIPGAFKRKVRWVVCGNLEPKKEGEQTYSGGADATALRVLIWASAKYGWKGCVLDRQKSVFERLYGTRSRRRRFTSSSTLHLHRKRLSRSKPSIPTTEGSLWLQKITPSLG